MPFLVALLSILLTAAARFALLLLAAFLIVTGIPFILGDPDHFWGWVYVLAGASLVFWTASVKTSTN